MTNFEYERLHHNLKLLKLRTFESILDNYLEIAAKEKRSISRLWIRVSSMRSIL